MASRYSLDKSAMNNTSIILAVFFRGPDQALHDGRRSTVSFLITSRSPSTRRACPHFGSFDWYLQRTCCSCSTAVADSSVVMAVLLGVIYQLLSSDHSCSGVSLLNSTGYPLPDSTAWGHAVPALTLALPFASRIAGWYGLGFLKYASNLFLVRVAAFRLAYLVATCLTWSVGPATRISRASYRQFIYWLVG